jgi:hypothetical protein
MDPLTSVFARVIDRDPAELMAMLDLTRKILDSTPGGAVGAVNELARRLRAFADTARGRHLSSIPLPVRAVVRAGIDHMCEHTDWEALARRYIGIVVQANNRAAQNGRPDEG